MIFKSMMKTVYLKLYRCGIFNIIPNRVFIPFQYKMATGKKLDLKRLETFNEKIQYIKLYDRNPIYPKVVDKYLVRDFVKEKIGEQFLIPLLGKWDKVEDIPIDQLPEQFVLKCNHDSGGIAICKNKDEFNWDIEKKKLSLHLKQNHYYMSREWAYKNVNPCIVAEKYMIDSKTEELRDYKFFCFDGIPKFIQVDFNRFVNHKRNIYDMNWNMLDLTIKCPNDSSIVLNKPDNFEEMVGIAKILSHGFPQVRVDLYSVDSKTYFGELTLYHGNGFEKFTPESFGTEFGKDVNLDLCVIKNHH